jgi:hypothetical protein
MSFLVEHVRTVFRLLTFRLTSEEFDGFGNGHLIAGLLCTWIVGIGRWWDDPGANILQHLGAGSVVYVFVLALVLSLVLVPLRPKRWSYKHVLTFVSLTSPPAILYAIPVERFTELSTARSINVWFLGIVASWRVALLLFYFTRSSGLSILVAVLATLLPIMAIIVTLTALNLERAVFDIMSGLRESGTANDEAYSVLFGLSLLSVLLFIPVLIGYIIAAVGRQSKEP